MTMEIREEARRREEERADLARRRELFARDLRSLAELPEGRRLFRWLIDQGNIFAEDYQPGPMGAYRSGLKAMSVRLWRMLEEHLAPAVFAAVALNPGREGAAEDEDGRRDGDARHDDYF